MTFVSDETVKLEQDYINVIQGAFRIALEVQLLIPSYKFIQMRNTTIQRRSRLKLRPTNNQVSS